MFDNWNVEMKSIYGLSDGSWRKEGRAGHIIGFDDSAEVENNMIFGSKNFVIQIKSEGQI